MPILFSSSKPPDLKSLSLKPYEINFSLDRLVFGVDNIHFDVHISQHVSSTLAGATALILIKHSRTEYYHRDYKRENCESEKELLKSLCVDVLQDGINRARIEAEPQIDYLGQAALAKLFLEEVKTQYKNLVAHFEHLVRTYELSPKHADAEKFRIREKLAEIRLHQSRLIRLSGEELFSLLTDIQSRGLRNMRDTHFHPEQILPDVFFNNPVLHTANPADDFFLTEEYVLLGKRLQDPDSYNNVTSIIYDLLEKTDLTSLPRESVEATDADAPPDLPDITGKAGLYNRWIMETGNIDRMFNVFELREQLASATAAGAPAETIRQIKQQIKTRERLLTFFYKAFRKRGLLRQIVAAYEMKSVYGIYCPPIAPRQIREYLVNFWSRRSIIRQLKRRKNAQGADLPLAPLKQTLRSIRRTSTLEKKQHLLNFLREFSRYHRDLHNAFILTNAMEAIRLVTEDKILQLSRGNRSLYEYLLSVERTREEKPVRNHVILKADIRGSISINHTMRAKGLNPASHFSLNFFDPISDVLANYDASKVFIEGDAVILSIFENEDTPEGWYSVARACGLAIRILQIVQRYNKKNLENNLPILEIGIGIAYSDTPPSYLFDGDSKIMISPAINRADRLSSCNKKLRRHYRSNASLFNLYVFKNAREDNDDSPDDLSLRYNVNGIELSEEGFAKLSREIHLKKVLVKTGPDRNVQIYLGKVPVLNGQYQMLAIREALIYEIHPETLAVTGETSRKYYEVCTSQELYDSLKSLAGPVFRE